MHKERERVKEAITDRFLFAGPIINREQTSLHLYGTPLLE